MKSIVKVIETAKKLINLPYNTFNLDNYQEIVKKSFPEVTSYYAKESLPIKLMSGGHKQASILSNLSSSVTSKSKIYIVGKGILFDSGGLDLKHGMTDMTGDKAGMIIALSVADYLKKNVVSYCPVTSNFIQTSKITPGDEIKIGKKIVKVTNTDAEGRLILAEAITDLNASKDDIIITVATLTGCVGYAIGSKATGVFSPNQEYLKKYAEASYEAKEYAWALPLWDYLEEEYYKDKIIMNSVKEIKEGATEAALFLKQFVPYPNRWIHLDVAYSAFDNKQQATGIPIKSLINFIKKLK